MGEGWLISMVALRPDDGGRGKVDWTALIKTSGTDAVGHTEIVYGSPH